MQAPFGACASCANRDAPILLGNTTVASAHRCHGTPRENSTSAAGTGIVSGQTGVANLRCDSAILPGSLWSRGDRIWGQGAKLVSSYFSGPSGDGDIFFAHVVRQNPFAAQRFIQLVMAFSASSSIVVCVKNAFFLPGCWNHDACGKSFLSCWLLVHCFLQLIQIPLHIVFGAMVDDVIGSEFCVSSITSSPAWRSCKRVSHISNAWLVLGILWLVSPVDTVLSTGVCRMVTAAIAQAVARALVAWISFWFLFPGEETEGRPVPLMVNGAEREQVPVLPLVRFKTNLLTDERASCAASCAVCLNEYQRGELLRRLPCGHYFHRNCADQWLCRSKRCPLCMQAIDPS